MKGSAEDGLMTDEEVRDLLAVSRTTLWRLRREGGLPFGRAGRKYLYWKTEILEWLRQTRAEGHAHANGATGSARGRSASSKAGHAARAVSESHSAYPAKEPPVPKPRPRSFHRTDLGEILLGDSLDVLADLAERAPNSVDLPFGLVRKKAYGNADASEYVEWFRPFGEMFKKVLKENGSLVIDIGGAWIPGQATRSLYHLKLPIMLCDDLEFHLAQEFYWWNPSKLPTPAEWVTVRRIRVKDAVNCVWWLSPSPWPKASNTRVLQPYSNSMLDLLRNGYKAKLRPSGHDISTKFLKDNGAAIPPNLIALANTESNGRYQRYCKEHNLAPHPARYPGALPEYFIRMLTNPGDLVVDPFAGSCVTGEVSERLERRWLCVELNEGYLRGALARFKGKPHRMQIALEGLPTRSPRDVGENYYRVPRPGLTWNGEKEPPLDSDGGRIRKMGMHERPVRKTKKAK
jgi:excisionase family DNA binding protein